MTDRHNERLRELFYRALELSAAERQTFLLRECGPDTELQRRLLAMIAAAEDEHFLAKPTITPGASLGAATGERPATEAPLREGPGTRIGPYKLLQLIGEGGFGAVFLAEQEKPVARKVALKVIKLGMDTHQVVARFEQERQALAMMDHPNIARVLDAGSTSTGRPYFVMDLVKGDPIAEYCDKNKLPIDDRLALFAQVCNAVQHAHSKGIIHRDIKPSNVLVGTQDGRPIAKVIDFGIAKATNSKLTDKTLFTEHHQVIGTLQYMSPEQAEGSLDIDTRTDVYSLGVLLYELLTGTTPFDRKTIQDAMFGELRRMIREVEPPRPSTRLNQSSDRLASIAAQRGVEPRRLGPIVRGELDWIVMKALEKDRSRRYETANGLALDIGRYLSGDAVVAAPPGAAYRLRKFVRRNRGPVGAIAAVGLALVIGAIGFAWQAQIATTARDLAIVAKAEATERATELQQVADFQAKMLAQVDATDAGSKMMQRLRERHHAALAEQHVPEAEWPQRTQSFTQELARINATDTATEVLDDTLLSPAVAAAKKQFATQPSVDASLRHTLATVYTKLGRYDQAMPLFDFALQTRKRVLSEANPSTLLAMNDTGNLLDEQGKYADAEPFYRAALAGRREHLGAEHPDTITSLGNLGGNLRYQGRLDEAMPLLREALELSRRVLGSQARDTLIQVNVMGYLLVDQHKFAEAEPYWRECYEQGKLILGAEDRDTLIWTNNLGGLLCSIGRPKEGVVFYQEAYDGARRLYGDEHPKTLGFLHNLASTLGSLGRHNEAESMMRNLIAARRRVLGDEHLDTLVSTRYLGVLLSHMGKLEEAEALLRSTADFCLQRYGDDNDDTLRCETSLAATLHSQGKLEEATALYRKVLQDSRKVWAEDSPDHLVVLNNLGPLLDQQGQSAEGETMLRQALAIRRRISGDDHPETLFVQSGLGIVLESQNKLDEAEALHRDAIQKFEGKLGAGHPNTLTAITNLASVLLKQKRYAEAEAILRPAITALEAALGKDHARTSNAHRLLGDALAALDRFAEAEPELLEAERSLAATSVSSARHRRNLKSLIALYEAWEKNAPGQGHQAQAATWQGKLAAKPGGDDKK